MGGGELIASFLDERAIDALVISFVPVKWCPGCERGL
jgi:dihydrofolate reductase